MAVENLGIYPNEQSKPIGTTLRIYPTSGTVAPYVRFETQSNGWYSANIWVTVYGIKKVGNEDINGYTLIGATGVIGRTRSNYTLVSGSEGTNYVYALPFSSITDGTTTLSSLLGTLSYAGRSYAALRLIVEARIYWDSGQVIERSSRGEMTCYIGFIPTFTVNQVYYDKNGLTITYTASGSGSAAWKRPNDRWAVNSLKLKIGSTTYALTGATDIHGTVGSAGKLTIPKSKLKRVPATGNTVQGTVRFVGSWMSVGTTLNTMALNTAVSNLYDVPAPAYASISATADGVSVTMASNSGIDYIEVSMVGGQYAIDRAIITPGSTHVFKGVPYGVATEWQAVAYSDAAGELAASQPVTATAGAVIPQLAKGAVFTDADGNEVCIPYDVSYTTQARAESTRVKLAGRQRPTVGFGEGGSVTWTVNGKVLFASDFDQARYVTTDREALDALPMAGVQLLRLPDGTRAQLQVTDCQTSRSVGWNGYRTVSISAEEVD